MVTANIISQPRRKRTSKILPTSIKPVTGDKFLQGYYFGE